MQIHWELLNFWSYRRMCTQGSHVAWMEMKWDIFFLTYEGNYEKLSFLLSSVLSVFVLYVCIFTRTPPRGRKTTFVRLGDKKCICSTWHSCVLSMLYANGCSPLCWKGSSPCCIEVLNAYRFPPPVMFTSSWRHICSSQIRQLFSSRLHVSLLSGSGFPKNVYIFVFSCCIIQLLWHLEKKKRRNNLNQDFIFLSFIQL